MALSARECRSRRQQTDERHRVRRAGDDTAVTAQELGRARKPPGRGNRWNQMVGMTGFEPATLRSQSGCATKLRYIPFPSSGCAGDSRWTGPGGRGLRTIPSSERVTGIEPAPSAWKAEVLPLNYTRRHTTPMGSPRCRLRVGLYRTSLPECQSHSRDSPPRHSRARAAIDRRRRHRPTGDRPANHSTVSKGPSHPTSSQQQAMLPIAGKSTPEIRTCTHIRTDSCCRAPWTAEPTSRVVIFVTELGGGILPPSDR